ncbi:glycosyltransferase [Flavobacterium branchiicola]|uniref:Glycosyltransferase n=1 Tax=Flavobacterium branchiicola TaxID=1114875 RepID=A0ABV9PHA7_9FLAO|nr:glycosyltransferase [Flavobacterium branchiicola]MBS7255493.1 glycosyltransferase [Flavobacterium branchiicola]
MRIVQIIDSLEAGGAERMAVSYANSLAKNIAFSGLVVTRKEGKLLSQVEKNVSYLFLRKNKKIDFLAILKLRGYIVKNEVNIVHAHSSSFFTAVLVKLTLPKLKIVWHDHYGSRPKQSKKQNRVLVLSSFFFSSIFVVNLQLKKWSQKNMFCKKVFFIPNFVSVKKHYEKITYLKGKEGRRIVFLANLKKPKNHIAVLRSFSNLKLQETDWSLHLIGRDYDDSYSQLLKDFIEKKSLEKHIHLYSDRNDIKHILSQCSIGVLASTDEGFPVTLLEYGLDGLAVVSTNVGYCSEIIQDNSNGLLFNPLNQSEIENQLIRLVENKSLRIQLGSCFKDTVIENYSEEKVIEKLIMAYKK